MKAALRTLMELETDGRRIAVLGSMSELGVETERGHAEVGEAAAALRIDHLIAIGELAGTIASAAEKAGLEKTTTVADPQAAAVFLTEIVAPGDLVLVKGSRSARTERVLEAFAVQVSTLAHQPL